MNSKDMWMNFCQIWGIMKGTLFTFYFILALVKIIIYEWEAGTFGNFPIEW